MKTFALTLIAAAGVLLASGNTVEAGGCGYGGRGGYGVGYGGGYGGGFSWNRGSSWGIRSSWDRGYGGHVHHNVNPYNASWGGGHIGYHDTSPFDYVPTTVIPHGNHFHVQPGGYYYHQTGHWDLYH
ncbi:MAG: hypothetical protein R3B90_19990 [Planctomycetaceae bacterium]